MKKEKLHGAAFAVIGLVFAACTATTTATTTTSTTVAPTTTTTSPSAEVIEVAMVDYAFHRLPETVPAGTRLTVVNESEAELHELVAFRLADDEERSAGDLTALAPEELGQALGAPVAVLIAAPGEPQVAAVGDGVLAEPGRYVLFCFIPTGVDPQEYLEAEAAADGPPQIEGAGPPHFVHGMVAELIVEG